MYNSLRQYEILIVCVYHIVTEKAYPLFLKAMTHLPLAGQVALVRVMSTRGADYLRHVLTSLQQLITIRIVSQSDNWSEHHTINNDDYITSAVKVCFTSNNMGSKFDPFVSVWFCYPSLLACS